MIERYKAWKKIIDNKYPNKIISKQDEIFIINSFCSNKHKKKTYIASYKNILSYLIEKHNTEVKSDKPTYVDLSDYSPAALFNDWKEEKANHKKWLKINKNTYLISWDNVKFCNDYIEIYNPSSNLTYRCKLIKSRKQFNNIKGYFKKIFKKFNIRLSRNIVYIDNYKLLKHIVNNIDIHNLKQYETNDIIQFDSNHLGNKYIRINKLGKSEIKTYIKQYKSHYLNYLCEKQLDEFKIKYALELRINNLKNEIEEDLFIFTIKKSFNTITIVLENTLEARSSIVVRIDASKYNEGVNAICDFFASNQVNKRELLSQRNFKIINSNILSIRRCYHTDFNSWKYDIVAL